MQLLNRPSDLWIHDFRHRLLIWFRSNRREFPWRETDYPYAVLLAEKLLQRTATRRDLVAAYEKLLSLYPHPELLAEADIADVKKIVSVLGLHYRAGELITLSRALCERYGGEVPNDLDLLMTLPGVGAYTGRAVLCFAFGQAVAVVDTNVARILYRVFRLPGGMPPNPARRRDLTELASSLVPQDHPREFNWALLDMGAAICSARRPKCSMCPITDLCSSALCV
ncbi:MAG: A/G-specific adenine glycosylase [Anaerolineae bacterium]|nr:A/G-specific adenine glycosylase [Anaerolineae bacterium]